MAARSKQDKAAKRAARYGDDERVYKMSEVVGTSKKSYADATSRAVERACKTLRNVDWFEVTELRGAVRDGKVSQYQVKLKVGFRLE